MIKKLLVHAFVQDHKSDTVTKVANVDVSSLSVNIYILITINEICDRLRIRLLVKVICCFGHDHC